MSPWLETVGVGMVAVLGVALGRASQRLRTCGWLAGYVFSIFLVALLALSQRSLTLQFSPPFSWFVAGRLRLVVLALAVTLGVSTLLPRLPRAWEKSAVRMLTIVLLLWSSILPFLAPAFLKEHLAHIETTIDANGVCLQSTRFTCGPAAAVTALRRLGLPAGEGQLAILSHASPLTGTLPATLCKALQDRYAPDGLQCRYRPFTSLAELRDAGITLAVVKAAFLLDHCVAVLDVSDDSVTVADPSTGVRLMSREGFEAIWRFRGIALSRADPRPDQG